MACHRTIYKSRNCLRRQRHPNTLSSSVTHGPHNLPISSYPYLTLCTSFFTSYAYPANKAMPRAGGTTQTNQTQTGASRSLVLSVLAGNRNGPGVPIHPNILLVVPDPSIPLVVQMANLPTKRKTMQNSLPVKYPM